MKKKEWIPYGLLSIALLIGAFYDYQITDGFYHSIPWIGEFFERIVLIPVQSIVLLTTCMMYRKKHQIRYLFLGFLASYYVVVDSMHYWMRIEGVWKQLLLVLIAVLYLGCMLFLVAKMNKDFLEKRLPFFLFFTIVLLSSILITSVIKEFWGRIRYRDMEDIGQFCVWYQPCGVAGNRSFPSGHTTAFTAILCLLQWKKNPFEKPQMWKYIGITILLILMPITRMIMGAHFLSDTAAGFMITYTCYLITRHYFRRGGYL